MNRYELLGRKWPYYRPLPELLEKLRQDDAVLAKSHSRAHRIKVKLMYPALQHLGFGAIEGLHEQVEAGLDLAVEFFCGTSLTEDQKRSDWFEAFEGALLLGGLAGRWEDIGRICSWFDVTVSPLYCAGTLEDEYFQLFVCIAGSLSPQPMPGAAELLASVKKCRTKRPRLLCAAWEAAIAADQAGFNKAFEQSVGHFLSKPEDGQVYDWLAIHQSAVWLIAEHRGLTFPTLPENLEAAVLTRQSVGFAG